MYVFMHIYALEERDDSVTSVIIFHFRFPWIIEKHGPLLKRFHFVPHVFHSRVNNNVTERGLLLFDICDLYLKHMVYINS